MRQTSTKNTSEKTSKTESVVSTDSAKIPSLVPPSYGIGIADNPVPLQAKFGLTNKPFVQAKTNETKKVIQTKAVQANRKVFFTSSNFWHIVQPGDTLSEIMQMYNTNLDELVFHNGSIDAQNLYPDQAIQIPQKGEDLYIFTVKYFDTTIEKIAEYLELFSKKHYLTFYNHLQSWDTVLSPGTNINIPLRWLKIRQVLRKPFIGSSINPAKEFVHVIQPNDTLSYLKQVYGLTSTAAIEKLNKSGRQEVTAYTTFIPGQQLVIKRPQQDSVTQTVVGGKTTIRSILEGGYALKKATALHLAFYNNIPGIDRPIGAEHTILIPKNWIKTKQLPQATLESYQSGQQETLRFLAEEYGQTPESILMHNKKALGNAWKVDFAKNTNYNLDTLLDRTIPKGGALDIPKSFLRKKFHGYSPEDRRQYLYYLKKIIGTDNAYYKETVRWAKLKIDTLPFLIYNMPFQADFAYIKEVTGVNAKDIISHNPQRQRVRMVTRIHVKRIESSKWLQENAGKEGAWQTVEGFAYNDYSKSDFANVIKLPYGATNQDFTQWSRQPAPPQANYGHLRLYTCLPMVQSKDHIVFTRAIVVKDASNLSETIKDYFRRYQYEANKDKARHLVDGGNREVVDFALYDMLPPGSSKISQVITAVNDNVKQPDKKWDPLALKMAKQAKMYRYTKGQGVQPLKNVRWNDEKGKHLSHWQYLQRRKKEEPTPDKKPKPTHKDPEPTPKRKSEPIVTLYEKIFGNAFQNLTPGNYTIGVNTVIGKDFLLGSLNLINMTIDGHIRVDEGLRVWSDTTVVIKLGVELGKLKEMIKKIAEEKLKRIPKFLRDFAIEKVLSVLDSLNYTLVLDTFRKRVYEDLNHYMATIFDALQFYTYMRFYWPISWMGDTIALGILYVFGLREFVEDYKLYKDHDIKSVPRMAGTRIDIDDKHWDVLDKLDHSKDLKEGMHDINLSYDVGEGPQIKSKRHIAVKKISPKHKGHQINATIVQMSTEDDPVASKNGEFLDIQMPVPYALAGSSLLKGKLLKLQTILDTEQMAGNLPQVANAIEQQMKNFLGDMFINLIPPKTKASGDSPSVLHWRYRYIPRNDKPEESRYQLQYFRVMAGLKDRKIIKNKQLKWLKRFTNSVPKGLSKFVKFLSPVKVAPIGGANLTWEVNLGTSTFSHLIQVYNSIRQHTEYTITEEAHKKDLWKEFKQSHRQEIMEILRQLRDPSSAVHQELVQMLPKLGSKPGKFLKAAQVLPSSFLYDNLELLLLEPVYQKVNKGLPVNYRKNKYTTDDIKDDD